MPSDSNFCVKRFHWAFFPILLLLLSCHSTPEIEPLPYLRVSENNRFLEMENGEAFFWLGDTGWLLFSKLTREEAGKYLENRALKGFNVIQVMVLQDVKQAVNVYGDSALIHNQVDQPLTTSGNAVEDTLQYDYWDHMDYVIDLAQQKGIYMALVPVWGSNVRNGFVSREAAGTYATWLAKRYQDRSNVLWLNGGDVKGSDSTAIWQAIGSTLRENNPNQLISFHPFGRTQSSTWFHQAAWLDFNMFQSGHRRYDQDDTALAYGQDNWKYVRDDYALRPVKPTIDGEPSYEGIPQGLHDPSQPYWTDADVRRYAYWSVFTGGFGFTYGHNAIMQFYKEEDTLPAYGAKEYWDQALDAPGASQMNYLNQLMVSKPYFDRVPDQDLIANNPGERYDHLVATRGNGYAFIYTYTGRTMEINLGKMGPDSLKASWYNPRNGTYTIIGTVQSQGTHSFDPPGEKSDGNDWVLVLESI